MNLDWLDGQTSEEVHLITKFNPTNPPIPIIVEAQKRIKLVHSNFIPSVPNKISNPIQFFTKCFPNNSFNLSGQLPYEMLHLIKPH